MLLMGDICQQIVDISKLPGYGSGSIASIRNAPILSHSHRVVGRHKHVGQYTSSMVLGQFPLVHNLR